MYKYQLQLRRCQCVIGMKGVSKKFKHLIKHGQKAFVQLSQLFLVSTEKTSA